MKKIWKFPLGTSSAYTISIMIPKGANLLTVGIQQRVFMLWAEIDTSAPEVTRNFVIYATGEPLIPGGIMREEKYVGTIIYDALSWHVYDLGEV